MRHTLQGYRECPRGTPASNPPGGLDRWRPGTRHSESHNRTKHLQSTPGRDSPVSPVVGLQCLCSALHEKRHPRAGRDRRHGDRPMPCKPWSKPAAACDRMRQWPGRPMQAGLSPWPGRPRRSVPRPQVSGVAADRNGSEVPCSGRPAVDQLRGLAIHWEDHLPRARLRRPHPTRSSAPSRASSSSKLRDTRLTRQTASGAFRDR